MFWRRGLAPLSVVDTDLPSPGPVFFLEAFRVVCLDPGALPGGHHGGNRSLERRLTLGWREERLLLYHCREEGGSDGVRCVGFALV